LVVEELPLELGLELDGLLEAPLALEGSELDGLLELLLPAPELMPLEDELEPEEPLCPACHSDLLSLPSWSLSSLSNSLEELDDDEPPAAELGLDEDDEEGDEVDDLLLSDVDGEALDPLELFDESAA
jgi:hypothetical protein